MTGLHQPGTSKDLLAKEVNASEREVVPYLIGSIVRPPGPTAAVILIERGSLCISFWKKGRHVGIVIRDSLYCSVNRWINKYSVFNCSNLRCSLLSSFSSHTKARFFATYDCYCSWSEVYWHTMKRFFIFSPLSTMKGTWLSESSTICRSSPFVSLLLLILIRQYGHYRGSVSRKSK